MTVTVSSGVLLDGFDDARTTRLADRNGSWRDPTIRIGEDEDDHGSGGDNHTPLFRFHNHNVPAKSVIQNAQMTVQITNSEGNVFSAVLRAPLRDNSWEQVSASGFRIASRLDFKMRLETAAAALIEETIPGGVFLSWEIRRRGAPEPDRFEHLAQSFTVTTTGVVAVGRVALQRVGAPAGTNNLWLEIWSDASDLPGTLLATSDTIDASSVTTGSGFAYHDFSFTGPDQITLTATVKYVLVLNATYARDDTNYIQWGYTTSGLSNGPYAGGRASMDGIGRGFDDQNYPLNVELGLPTIAVPDVFWTLPAATGLTTSPNFASIVQAVVNDSAYVDGAPMGFMLLSSGDEGDNRDLATVEHATAAQATLTITHRARRRAVL